MGSNAPNSTVYVSNLYEKLKKEGAPHPEPSSFPMRPDCLRILG